MQPFDLASWWTPGESHLHVYARPTPSQSTSLARLTATGLRVAADHADVVQPIPSWRLHATIAAATTPVGDRGAAVQAVAEAIRDAGVGPVPMRWGSVMATRSGILVDAGDIDAGRWRQLSGAAAAGLRAVCGEATAEGSPHITLAYGTGETDSGPIGSELRRECRPPHAEWTIPTVWVVDVDYDPDRRCFEWVVIGQIDL